MTIDDKARRIREMNAVHGWGIKDLVVTQPELDRGNVYWKAEGHDEIKDGEDFLGLIIRVI